MEIMSNVIFLFFVYDFLKLKKQQTDRVHILEDRSLRLENVILDDEGEYSCEADNSVGSVSATGMLSVLSKCISRLYLFYFFVRSKEA